jgi:predicted transposase YbfD/YdcC
MVVGANQPSLHADLALLFADATLVAETGTRACQVNAGHGRVERRELRTSTALVGYSAWPGLAQVLCLDRTRTCKRTGQTEQERVYAVTSLTPAQADAHTLLHFWRGHWTIENGVHWVRDVVMHEDASQVRSGAAPQVLAALRNALLSLLRAHGYAAITATRRHFAWQPAKALALLGLP